MFATDRDLMAIEPGVFNEAAWIGQKLLTTTGAISGTTLTINGGDLAALGIGAGHVVIVTGVPLEVVARLSTTTATVSLLRPSVAGAAIPPVSGTGFSVEVWTLRPQIEIAHRSVVRMLGMDPDASPSAALEGEIVESMITNPSGLVVLESLLALHAAYSSAGASAPATSGLGKKAEMFKERAGVERSQAVARIDADGDGRPEFARRPTAVPLVRG